jgi:hypothetical protein
VFSSVFIYYLFLYSKRKEILQRLYQLKRYQESKDLHGEMLEVVGLEVEVVAEHQLTLKNWLESHSNFV